MRVPEGMRERTISWRGMTFMFSVRATCSRNSDALLALADLRDAVGALAPP